MSNEIKKKLGQMLKHDPFLFVSSVFISISLFFILEINGMCPYLFIFLNLPNDQKESDRFPEFPDAYSLLFPGQSRSVDPIDLQI